MLPAIAHRDYSSNAHIQIDIYSDRLEIVNPGGLQGGLSLDQLIGKSHPRNPLLFSLLQRMDLVEEVGSGLLRISKALQEYGMNKPDYTADNNWFTVVFKRPDLQVMTMQQRLEGESGSHATDKTTDKTTEKLTDQEKDIIALIQTNSHISQKEMGEQLDLTVDGIRYHTDKLKKKGILKRVGGKKGGKWEVLL